jgi:hypothetical protein
MTRPLRVRVSFELTPEEADMLNSPAMRFVWMGGCGPRLDMVQATTEKFWTALRRGLERYRARTKGEVGDG